MKYVFLSPHFDDTTLSCGAWIADLIASGADVSVIVVMAGEPISPIPDTPLIQELHQRWDVGLSPVLVRQDEERHANQRLGLKADNLTLMQLPDCIYRTFQGQALYPDGEAIFGSRHPDDPAFSSLRNDPLPDDAWIVAPMAVGNHVDHQTVKDWAIATVPPERLIFYEDYPYAHTSNQAFEIAEADGLSPKIRNVTQEAFQAKYEAILCYASQISTFWRSDAELRANLYDYMSRVAGEGSIAERYWHNEINK